MDELYNQLEQWVENQKYRYSMGEWFKGRSSKAITTDKLAELVPQMIKDNHLPKDIKEQLAQVAITLEAEEEDDSPDLIDFDEIANIGVSNSIYSVGKESIKLEFRGFPNVPSAVDVELMKNIAYAVDSNERIVFFFMSRHESNCTQYTMIDSKDMDLDVESALLKSRMYMEIQTWWENLLLKWEQNIVRLWNTNVRNPHDAVQAYVLANIPVTMITATDISIVGTKRETGAMVNGVPEEIVVARGVKFEVMKGRVQFSDFVAMNVKTYKSAAITELAKMPKIYGNAGEDAMSIFDIRKYFNREAVLSPYWEEVKSKYTADEWAVLCAWTIGALDSGNTGRQSLAQIDYDGYSGKSVLSDVLTQILSLKNVGAIGKGALSDKFWASKLWNKRLVIVDDNKNSRLLQTEAVHCVLGAGYADVEYKGEASFTWKMSSKLLINSNIDLEINSAMLHERSRVIIVNPKMPKTLVDKLSAKDEQGNVILDQRGNPKLLGDPKFAENLVSTIDGFLTEALGYYKKLCPNRADIILPDSVLEKVYENESSEETMFNSILNKAFIITNNDSDSMTQSEFMEQYMMVTRGIKIYNAYASNQEFSNFKQFIKKNNKIAASGKMRLFRGITASNYVGPDENNPNSPFKAVEHKKGFGGR